MKCCEIIDVRHKCIDNTSLEGKEVKNTIVLTFAFQVVFTGFNALQNLHSSLHDEESLGNYCLAIMYCTAVVSSILSPTIIGLIGAKTVLVAAFAAHCVYVLANFYPSFATMAPAALALGAFHGPAWTSQALYISACASSFSKSSSTSPYSILSRFNGLFFSVLATCQIVGNLVTSTVIRGGVGNSSGEVLVFKYCGADDCPAGENTTEIEDPEAWVIDITLGFFMGCALLGLLLVFFLLSPLPRSDWIQRVTVRSTTTSCFHVLLSVNMILLVPFILFTSIEHAMLVTVFTKAFISCPIGIHMVGYVMAAYGATTPIFMFIFSKLVRFAGRFVLLMLSQVTFIVLLIVLLRWSPTREDEVLIFIVPMIWGVSESILQAQANSLIAMLYPSKKEPAFANFHAWRSLGYAVTFLNATYLCVYTKLSLAIACGSLGTLLYAVVELRTKMKEKQTMKNGPKLTVTPESVMSVENRADSFASNRTSVSSFQSVQERLSFDRVELAEIIEEAKAGWTRNQKGLTLEVNKVMSIEHLQESKVTNWYHVVPFSNEFIVNGHPAGLPRSMSDGHLNYNVYEGGFAVVQMRRGSTQLNVNPNHKRRHLSDIERPTFESIPEEEREDMEAVIKVMKAMDFISKNSGKHYETDVDDDNGDDDVFRDSKTELGNIDFVQRDDEDAATSGRRGGEGVQSRRGLKLRIPSQRSLSSSLRSHESFSPDPTVEISPNGYSKVKFHIGPRGESPAAMVPFFGTQTLPHKLQRPHSYDASYSRHRSESNGESRMYKRTQRPLSNGALDSKIDKRRRHAFGLKVLPKSKKGVKKKKASASKHITSRGEEGLSDTVNDLSDTDSDGFVNDIHSSDNELNFAVDNVAEIMQRRRKNSLPVCESEDVTCIY